MINFLRLKDKIPKEKKARYLKLSKSIDSLSKDAKKNFNNKKDAIEYLELVIPLFEEKYDICSNASDKLSLTFLKNQLKKFKGNEL